MSYPPPVSQSHHSHAHRHSMPDPEQYYGHLLPHVDQGLPRQPYPNTLITSNGNGASLPPHHKHHHHQRGASYPTPGAPGPHSHHQHPTSLPLPNEQLPTALANRRPPNLGDTSYLTSLTAAAPLMTDFFAESPSSKGLSTPATAFALRAYLEVFLHYMGYDPSNGTTPQIYVAINDNKLAKELGLPVETARMLFSVVWDLTTPVMESVCHGIIGMEKQPGYSEDMCRAMRHLFRRNHGLTPEEMLSGGGKVVGPYGESILEEKVLPGVIRDRKKLGGLGPIGAVGDGGDGQQGGGWKKIWKKGWKFSGKSGKEEGGESFTNPSGGQKVGEDVLNDVDVPEGAHDYTSPPTVADGNTNEYFSAQQQQEAVASMRREGEGRPQRSKSQRQQQRTKQVVQTQTEPEMESRDQEWERSGVSNGPIAPIDTTALTGLSSRAHHFRRRSGSVDRHNSVRKRERRAQSGSVNEGATLEAAVAPPSGDHHSHSHHHHHQDSNGQEIFVDTVEEEAKLKSERKRRRRESRMRPEKEREREKELEQEHRRGEDSKMNLHAWQQEQMLREQYVRHQQQFQQPQQEATLTSQANLETEITPVDPHPSTAHQLSPQPSHTNPPMPHQEHDGSTTGVPFEGPSIDSVEQHMSLPLPPLPLFFGQSRPSSRVGSVANSASYLPLPPSTADLRSQTEGDEVIQGDGGANSRPASSRLHTAVPTTGVEPNVSSPQQDRIQEQIYPSHNPEEQRTKHLSSEHEQRGYSSELDSTLGGNATEISGYPVRKGRVSEGDRGGEERKKKSSRDKHKHREGSHTHDLDREREKKHKHKHRSPEKEKDTEREERHREEKKEKERSVRSRDPERRRRSSIATANFYAPGPTPDPHGLSPPQPAYLSYQGYQEEGAVPGQSQVESSPTKRHSHGHSHSHSHSHSHGHGHGHTHRHHDRERSRVRDKSRIRDGTAEENGEKKDREKKERRKKEKRKEREREKERAEGEAQVGAGIQGSGTVSGAGETIRRRRKERERGRVDREKLEVEAQGGIVV